MSHLIDALTIFLKYGDIAYPTGCEHDKLYVYVDPAKVSLTDIEALEVLGFHASIDDEHFYSFRYGSA